MLQDLPDPLGSHRHLQPIHLIADPGRLQRIEHRVHHCRRGTDGAEFADTLHAERIGQTRNRFIHCSFKRHGEVDPGHRIVEEGCSQCLPGISIVDHPF